MFYSTGHGTSKGISKGTFTDSTFPPREVSLTGLNIQIKLRLFQIDIDDIFVGKNRLLPTDVDALLESQKQIRKMVPDFRYNLGFSGGVFKTGNYDEQVTQGLK